MCAKPKDPTTLLEAVRYFSDQDVALEFVARLRWPDGKPACPKCGAIGEHYFLEARRLWKCRDCKKQFSIKVGTIFEDSPIALSKWLPALWMLANCKNGISSYELSRALGVTQKTAWFMLHRIRLAMQSESFAKMGGEVEIDETYIGGRARNMHHDRRKRTIKGTGGMGKAAVIGLLERHGKDGSQVRVRVLKNVRKGNVHSVVRKHVEKNAELMTDNNWAYRGLDEHYIHQVIDHAEAYVRGNVHTKGLENFWSLLKRSLKGTYVAVEPFHLFRYLDEQAFRFNARKWSDLERFVHALGSVLNRRVTYRALTGQALSETC